MWVPSIVRDADADTQQAELDWACARPESRWSDVAGADVKPMANTLVDGQSVWEACLTNTEHKFFLEYLSQFPGSVYSLNQNPSVKPMYAHGKASRQNNTKLQ